MKGKSDKSKVKNQKAKGKREKRKAKSEGRLDHETREKGNREMGVGMWFLGVAHRVHFPSGRWLGSLDFVGVFDGFGNPPFINGENGEDIDFYEMKNGRWKLVGGRHMAVRWFNVVQDGSRSFKVVQGSSTWFKIVQGRSMWFKVAGVWFRVLSGDVVLYHY